MSLPSPQNLPTDLWNPGEGFDTDSPKDLYALLTATDQDTYTKRVDLVLQVAEQFRQSGEPKWVKRTAAALGMEANEGVVQAEIKIGQKFRLELGWSREELKQYPKGTLRTLAQKGKDFITKDNEADIRFLLTEPVTNDAGEKIPPRESDVKLGLEEMMRAASPNADKTGGDKARALKNLKLVGEEGILKLIEIAAETMQARTEALEPGAWQPTTSAPMNLSQAIWMICNEFLYAEHYDLEGNPVPNRIYMDAKYAAMFDVDAAIEEANQIGQLDADIIGDDGLHGFTVIPVSPESENSPTGEEIESSESSEFVNGVVPGYDTFANEEAGWGSGKIEAEWQEFDEKLANTFMDQGIDPANPFNDPEDEPLPVGAETEAVEEEGIPF